MDRLITVAKLVYAVSWSLKFLGISKRFIGLLLALSFLAVIVWFFTVPFYQYPSRCLLELMSWSYSST